MHDAESMTYTNLHGRAASFGYREGPWHLKILLICELLQKISSRRNDYITVKAVYGRLVP